MRHLVILPALLALTAPASAGPREDTLAGISRCAALPDEPGVNWLASRAAGERGVQRERARDAIASRRYESLVLELGAWLAAHRWHDTALAQMPAARFGALHDDMLATLTAPLHRQGHGDQDIAVERTALIRYVGQSYAVEVPFTAPLDLPALGRDFRRRHHEIYGYATDEHWEMQSLRLRALVARRTRLGSLAAAETMPEPTSVGDCWFEPAAPHRTPRFDRDRLPTGARIDGPAIVEDAWSTIVVPPAYILTTDTMGHLWIREAKG